MEKFFQRRGYQDWAGEVDGYGSGLEIRVYATVPDSKSQLPDEYERSQAPVHLHPPRLSPQPLEKDPRIQAMLNFADAIKK